MKNKTFNDNDVRRAWNEVSAEMNEFIESGGDYYRDELHGPALLDACGDVNGLDVLDIGCGQGYFSRQLANRGARVTAVDISEKQLEIALTHETDQHLGIDYRNLSSTEIHNEFIESRFDLITSCMSLHDMADPSAALISSNRVLRTRGQMIISMPHPFTTTPYREWELSEDGEKLSLKVDKYFDSGPTYVRWSMLKLTEPWESPFTRLTLSEWADCIYRADFLIALIYEPRPTLDQIKRVKELDEAYRLPGFLIFSLIKANEPYA